MYSSDFQSFLTASILPFIRRKFPYGPFLTCLDIILSRYGMILKEKQLAQKTNVNSFEIFLNGGTTIRMIYSNSFVFVRVSVSVTLALS